MGFVLIGLGITVYLNYPKLNLISGFAAKSLSSGYHIAKHPFSYLEANDNDIPLVRLSSLQKANNTYVVSSVFGLMPRKAVYRQGLGSVLTNKDYNESTSYLTPNRSKRKDTLPFPFGNNGKKDSIFSKVDYIQLDKALAYAFHDNKNQKTRTVLIAYKNQIIAENYVAGFTAKTPVLGWSMTKSILATLYGVMDYQNKSSLEEHPFVNAIDKDKGIITLNHLLRMQSGLDWNEDYTTISDVTKMLFLEQDMTLSQANKSVVKKQGTVWNYSSGTSNFLSGYLRSKFNSHQEYLDYPYSSLIDKIGMHSMLLEADLKGNYVASSYGWANTRDWAKFGLLYLNNGLWNGERIFSDTWVNYVTTPTQNSDGVYGAHFWLNTGGKFPNVPRDMYSANGFQGQYVFIIPSKNLVVVRTGLAENPDFDVDFFLSEVCKAIK